MSKYAALAPVTLLVFTSGCASIPEPVVAPTGEALSVEGKTTRYTYTAKEKVGTVKSRDAQGYTHHDDVYADTKKVGKSYTWSAYQGDTKIADDDLFHIAKDEKAQEEIHDYRASGVFENRLGWGLLAAGGGAIAGGLLLYKNAGENGETKLPGAVFLAGTFAVGIASYLIFHGSGKTTATHPLGQDRARQAADRYNSTLR